MDTQVIYLVWGPLGAEPLKRFTASYLAHPAELEHRLVLLLKGVNDSALEDECRDAALRLGADCVEIPAVGLDLDAYSIAAHQFGAGVLCFLNTSSEILGDRWLAIMSQALQQSGVGLVGSTASNETVLTGAPRLFQPLLRARFPAFPNPHVRTNGFMLDRELMLTLEWPAVSRKWAAFQLESGRRSLTRQVWARGLRALIVGRDGRWFGPEQWAQSGTFRSGSQANLLIGDNRTREYAGASLNDRAQLARSAWGDSIGCPD